MWQVCGTHKHDKAGSRTVLVVYRTLGSYVGFGVHQIEFATTLIHTHSLLALLLPSHTTIVFLDHPARPALLHAACSSSSVFLIVLQSFCLLHSSALHVTVTPT